MKGLQTLKVILILFLFTNFSYKLSAQNYQGSNDSVKRVIVVVRPGYSDQSPTYNNSSNNNASSGLSSATTSSLAPTVSERAGAPDYMNPTVKKRTPIHTSLVPQQVINNSAITVSPAIKVADTTLSATNIKTKRDTVFITKRDTILITTPKHSSNKILFLELGGPGLAISLNYDQRFSSGKEGFGYRVGMGYFGDGGNTVFTIPLQVNYLIGKDGKYFEFGGGTTFLNTTGDNTGKTFIFDRLTGFIGTATIGVRYEPQKSLNFRLAFVPIFAGPGEGIIYAGGFSMGYTF